MLIEKLKQIHDVIALRKGHFNFLQSSLLVLYETDDDSSSVSTYSSSSTLTCTDGTDGTDESDEDDECLEELSSASSTSTSSASSSPGSGASVSSSPALTGARVRGGVPRVDVRLIDFDHTHYKRAIPTASSNASRPTTTTNSNGLSGLSGLVISDPRDNKSDGQSASSQRAVDEKEEANIGDSGVLFGVSSLLRLLMKMELEL